MPKRVELTHPQLARFRLMWKEGERVAVICETFAITHDAANRIRVRLGLVARTPQTRAKPAVPYRDPTPAEIAERSAAIRATWPPDVEEKRRVSGVPRPYEFPVVRIADVDDATAAEF